MHNRDIVHVLGILFPMYMGVNTMLLLGRAEKEVLLHCPGHWTGVRWGKGHNLLQMHLVLSVSLFFFTSILFCLLFNHSQGWLAFCLTCLHYTLLQSIWQAEISRRRHVLLSVRAGGREGDQASQLQPHPGRQTEIQPKKPPPDARVLFPSWCPLPGSEQQVKVFLPLPALGGQAAKPLCGNISTESSFFCSGGKKKKKGLSKAENSENGGPKLSPCAGLLRMNAASAWWSSFWFRSPRLTMLN